MRVEFLMDFQSVNECLTSCFTLQTTFGKIFFFCLLARTYTLFISQLQFLIIIFFFFNFLMT